MSRLLGRELPQDLVSSLDAGPGPKFEDVILMVTVDESSRPHVAMLSRWEVFAAGKGELRLATYVDSTTTKNLIRNGAVTLVLVNERMSYYVKGTARLLRETMRVDPHNSMLGVAVTQVYEDRLPGAEMLSGMRFAKAPGVEPHEALFSELVSG